MGQGSARGKFSRTIKMFVSGKILAEDGAFAIHDL
jgi:hypothetical protein